MRPGDILLWKGDASQDIRLWRVLGVFLGALHQESVIELAPMSHSYPEAYGKTIASFFVPEVMLRSLSVYRQTDER